MSGDPPVGVEHRPVGSEPVEAVIARNTVKHAVWVAPVLVLALGITRGADGALWAAVGVAVVVGNLLLAGWVLSVAARISLRVYHAVALGSFLLRLLLIVATMLAIVAVVEPDRVAFGIAAVASYMVLLTWEAVRVARGRERELDWAR